MKILEYAKYRINKLIEESGIGIADEVDAATEKIYNIAIGQEGRSNIECFGVTIKLFVSHYDFSSQGEYHDFIGGNPMAYWVEQYKWLKLTIPYINGKIVNRYDIYDAIQHELEHAYQNIKMGHGFGNEQVYGYAISRLQSNDIYEKSLARIIYASTRSEQDAMINGLYATIKAQQGENLIDDIVKESEAFSWLQNLYQARHTLKTMKNNSELILKYISPYTTINRHYTYGKFNVIARQGIKDFEWKIARLVKGCKKRFITENNIRPYVSSKINYKNNWLYFLN